LEELANMVQDIRVHAEKIGRTDPIDIAYMTTEGGWVGDGGFDRDRHVEAIGTLAELGVTWIAGNVSGSSVNEIVDNLGRYGAEVIETI
jgi:hypothetical protein